MPTKHGHVIEWETCFCTRCGRSRLDLVKYPRECVAEGSNVTAISHIVAARRKKERLEARVKKDKKD